MLNKVPPSHNIDRRHHLIGGMSWKRSKSRSLQEESRRSSIVIFQGEGQCLRLGVRRRDSAPLDRLLPVQDFLLEFPTGADPLLALPRVIGLVRVEEGEIRQRAGEERSQVFVAERPQLQRRPRGAPASARYARSCTRPA